MPLFAYRDKERTKIIRSMEATSEDKKIRLYCPNINCDAHLFIRSVDGLRLAHFAATQKAYPHADDCPYKYNHNQDIAYHCDESEFTFSDAIEALCVMGGTSQNNKSNHPVSEGPIKEHPPKTIRQIYDVCRAHSIEDKYGDTQIKDMILDERTAYLYLSDWSGPRLAKTKVRRLPTSTINQSTFYSKKLHQIYLWVDSEEKIPLVLMCQEGIYNTVQNSIYHNRNNTIVVAGKWYQSEGVHAVKIFSRKQVTTI